MVAIVVVFVLLPPVSIDKKLSDLYGPWPGITADIDEIFVSQPMKSIGRLTAQDLAYKQGLREGLQRLVANESEFWREVVVILIDLSGDCDSASEPPGCQVAFIDRSVLRYQPPTKSYLLVNKNRLVDQRWCHQERFVQQPSLASCTGVLVTDRLVSCRRVLCYQGGH